MYMKMVEKTRQKKQPQPQTPHAHLVFMSLTIDKIILVLLRLLKL